MIRGKKRLKKRGTSLIEMLIVSFLLMLFLSLIFLFFYMFNSYWFFSDAKNRVHLDANLAMEVIRNDLRESDYDSFTNNTSVSPPAISFQSALNTGHQMITDANGNPVWQRYIIYYLDSGTNRLLKREITPCPAAISPLSQAALSAYCTGAGKPIIHTLSGFQAATDALKKSITLTVTTEVTYGNKGNRIILDSEIFPLQK